MYQLRQLSNTAFRAWAVFVLCAQLTWLDVTAHGQDSWDPYQFQPGKSAAPSTPRRPADTSLGQVTRASFNQSVGEAPARLSSGAADLDSQARLQAPGALVADNSHAKAASGAASQQQSGAPPNSAALNPAPTTYAPIPLARNTAATDDSSQSQPAGGIPGGTDWLVTVAGSLGIVMGLFMVAMWCVRRSMPKAVRPLPPEVVEVLGRAPLAGRQQMHLIRFGSKLVLATVSPTGIDSISEITDPVEADRLLGYCEQTRTSSATASFRGILDRLDDRGLRSGDEPSRRSREYSSSDRHKHARLEDEYV